MKIDPFDWFFCSLPISDRHDLSKIKSGREFDKINGNSSGDILPEVSRYTEPKTKLTPVTEFTMPSTNFVVADTYLLKDCI